jgi:hypothetical protein
MLGTEMRFGAIPSAALTLLKSQTSPVMPT